MYVQDINEGKTDCPNCYSIDDYTDVTTEDDALGWNFAKERICNMCGALIDECFNGYWRYADEEH